MTDREIIRIVHRSFWYYFFPCLASLIILLGAFFFMIPLFHFSWWGKAIFWFLVFLSFFYGLSIIIKWRGNKLIITVNQVIVGLQTSFFVQKLFKISYEKIGQVNVVFKGLFSSILRLGTIEILLVGEKEPICFSGLRRPEKIQELILHYQDSQQREKERITKNLTQYQLIEMARSLREKIGREIFRQIAEEE